MTVSIIVPVYNVEDYIEDCIKSVLKQTYKNIELIIVDDAGEDESTKLAQKILQDSSIKYTIIKHERNRGLSAARNTGVMQAEGKYLFFLDSDDKLLPDCILKLVEKAEKDNAEMTFGNHCRFSNDDTDTSLPYRNNTMKISADALYGYLQGFFPSTAWNRLILTSWYKQTNVKFIEGILHEDESWSLSLALRCKSVSFINDVTYLYRMRENSIITNSNNTIKKITGRIAQLKDANIQLNLLYKKWPDICVDKYQRLLWNTANDIFSLKNKYTLVLLKELFSVYSLPFYDKKNSAINLFCTLNFFLPKHLAYIAVRMLGKRFI